MSVLVAAFSARAKVEKREGWHLDGLLDAKLGGREEAGFHDMVGVLDFGVHTLEESGRSSLVGPRLLQRRLQVLEELHLALAKDSLAIGLCALDLTSGLVKSVIQLLLACAKFSLSACELEDVATLGRIREEVDHSRASAGGGLLRGLRRQQPKGQSQKSTGQ